jgi:predicted dehydrogenase
LVNKAGGTEIVALCDVYEPRLRAVKEKLAPGAAGYADYRELLDRKDIDAVVIGSPDHWHVPMTIDAVKAGKDVYVEKPVSHGIEEGARLEQVVAASKQIVQVGYQQRSWEHFKVAREVITGGKLGKITLILASWYQNYLRNRGSAPQVEVEKLDWKKFLGPAPNQPFDALRYTRWRWFWDFGGGHLTDLYSHYCDVIHWYMGEDSPLAAQATGGRNALPEFECPDTISAAYEYPGGFNVVYNGSLVGSLDGGNILFRGSQAMMKINRDGFAVYREGVVPAEKTYYPDPEDAMQSGGDGTISHVNNFLECVRSRKAPASDVKSAVATARAAHLGNMAYRKGSRVDASPAKLPA